MPPSPRPPEAAKQHVARVSFLLGAALLACKLAVYFHSRSLGILAEAAHSALDLLATLMTWISLRIAARPADADHPFGHEKFENFWAFFQMFILVLTGLALGISAWSRWTRPPAAMVVDFWAFAVMLTAMAIDWRRGAMLRRAARLYDSDLLAADALNFSSDFATAAVVLLGLALVAAGQRWHLPALARADALAAAAVAVTMMVLGLRLGRRTAGALLDEAPAGLSAELRSLLSGVDGIAAIPSLRLRRAGSRFFVDLRLQLAGAVTLEGAETVRIEVARRIHRRLPAADIVVEIQPGGGLQLPLDQIQAIARRQNLNLHDLTAYALSDGLEIEFHLELPPSLTLAEAHDRVCRLEAAMRDQVASVRRIVTHIEPVSQDIGAVAAANPEPVRSRVLELAAAIPGMLDCHEIELRQTDGHLALSCHCTFPDAMPVAQVHVLATTLEARIKRDLPELFRVTIHPEPGSDNTR